MVTGVVPLAVPLNEGDVLFDGDVGWSSVTAGDSPSRASTYVAGTSLGRASAAMAAE
jgi:hypothetical protein